MKIAPIGPSLRLAVGFLTIVPVRLRGEVPALGAAAAWFPAVGALVGVVAGGVAYVAEPLVGAHVAAVLAVAVLVVLTGALHQDGLADCADGFGARRDRERRLAIMRDPSIGTFGALALLLWLLLLVTALAGLEREDASRALVTAVATSRWAVLVHAVLASPARSDGLGALFTVSGVAIALATASAVAVAVVVAGIVGGLLSLGVATSVAVLVTAWSRRTLGGRTGDTLGATVALAEVAVTVALLGAANS